jgi:glycosyltransferase involved in cell wall biosynthesis
MYPTEHRPGWGSFVQSQVESLRKAGIEVDVLIIEGYRNRWEYLRAIRTMRRMIREVKYDLIHAHYGLSGLVARFQFSVPIVMSFCGDDLYGHARSDGSPHPASLPLAWIHRQLSRFVDASIVKSEAMKSLLPRPTASVIPNGVDLNMFRPMDRAAARQILKLDPDPAYILFPYSPERVRKNFAALQQAVHDLTVQRPDLPSLRILTVAGEPQERLPIYMNAADIMVLPSFWEGSPNAVKEALACNLKIVATDVGDVRERISNVAGTALCEPVAESIAKGIVEVIEERRPPNGREAVDGLSLEKVADRLIEVYHNVLRQRGRVLIISENLPVPLDRRVWREANALQEAGWHVSIISPKRGSYAKSRETLNGIEIYRHPLPEARNAWAYPFEYGIALFWQVTIAWRIYLTRGFDIIHACNPPDLIFLVAAPFKALGVRFIFDHHDLCPELAETKFGKGRAAAVMRSIMLFLERQTFRLADASIATNQSYRDVAIHRGGMISDRVYVVRSAPDHRLWRPVPADPALRSNSRFLVGYVGVIGSQEGLADLLLAIKHLVHELHRRDISFILVGDGPERKKLEAEARDHGIDDRVHFTGRVSDEDLIRILSSCDICVNADLATPFNNLSSMNKIVEYMALGKPLVQIDLIEGRFTAMESALYAAPNDPKDFADRIIELLSNPERLDDMGKAGRRRFEEALAWKHQVPSLLACYEHVASLRASRGNTAETASRGGTTA